MTTVYLHIGIPKTGTTSLQNFLLKNRENLLAQGILYPTSGITINPNFNCFQSGDHNLFWALDKECKAYDSNAGDWEDIHREIKTKKSDLSKVLISAEDFSTINDNRLSLLKEHLSRYNTKVIVYLRKQDDYFMSFYCEYIKICRYWDSPIKYIEDNKNFGDYYQLLKRWKKAFGKENIIVRVFDRTNLKGGLINDFLMATNLNLDELKLNFISKNKNVTPSIKLIKIMRFLNEFYRGRMHKSPMRLKKLYKQTVLSSGNPISSMVSNLPDSLISPELLTTQERIDLMKEFEESNRKVAQEYLGREDGKLFDSTPDNMT